MAIFIAFSGLLKLQGQQFQNYYEFSNNGSTTILPSIGYDLIQTSDPKYLLMGGALRTGDKEMLLVNMKGNGQVSNWAYKYKAQNYDDGGNIRGITEVGGTHPGYVVVGAANEKPTGTFVTIPNRMVMKVDPHGNWLWAWTGPNAFMIDVADDPNSNRVFALGLAPWCAGSGPACYNSSYLAAFDKNTGNLLWERVYRADMNTSNTESPTGIVLDNNGNVIFCANSTDANGINRISIFKTDSTGTLQINKSYFWDKGNVNLMPEALAIKPNGNYIVVSRAKQTVLNRNYVHAMEISPTSGNILPNRSVLVKDANVEFFPEDVKVMHDGQTVIVGSGNNKRGLYVRLSGALLLAKVRIYSNTLLPGTNRFTAVDSTSDGHLAITGRVDGNFWFVRAKKAGVAVCEYDINKNTVPIPLSDTLQGTSLLLSVPSMIPDSLTATPIVWTKHDECAGSSPRLGENTEFEKAESVLLYPNPTKGLIEIQLEGFDQMAEIRILNVQGAIVDRRTYVIKESRHHLQLDLSHLSSGLYFVEIRADGEIKEMQKLMIE